MKWFTVYLLALLCASNGYDAKHVPRIFNGNIAEEGQFPFAVHIGQKNPVGGIFRGFCTGSIIRNDAILTAAHCQLGIEPSFGNVYINAGTKFSIDIAYAESLGQMREMRKWINHPKYLVTGISHDIAVIKLKGCLHFNHCVRPIALPSSNRPYNGERGIVAGWGSIAPGMHPSELVTPKTLRYAKIQIATGGKCPIFNDIISMPKDIICQNKNLSLPAEYVYGTPRPGDSGGPLASNDLNCLLGVSAYVAGPEEDDHKLSSFYTSVSYYLGFIKEAIRTM